MKNKRHQVSSSVSGETLARIDRLSLETGLSRSRLYDLALAKFVQWAEHMDPYQLRLLSAEQAPSLGYARKESGFRRSTRHTERLEEERAPRVDPYSIVPLEAKNGHRPPPRGVSHAPPMAGPAKKAK